MKEISSTWKQDIITPKSETTDFSEVYISKYLWKHSLASGGLFLFNMLTGFIDVFDRKEKVKFEILEQTRMVSSEMGQGFVSQLLSHGHVWKSIADENTAAEKLIEELSTKAFEQDMMFFLCVNHSCPVGCRHCFELDVPILTQTPPMSDEIIEAAFKDMDDIKAKTGRDGKVINIFGGEPFMPKTLDSVSKILSVASEKGYRLTTYTSGIFLEPFFPLLKEHTALFDWISITLDVSENHFDDRRRIKNSYQRVVININYLVEIGLPVIVRINLDQENIDCLPETVRVFREIGWLSLPNLKVQLSPVTDHHCVRTDKIAMDEVSLVIKLEELKKKEPDIEELFDRGCYFSLDYLAVKLGYRKPNVLDYTLSGPRVHFCMTNNRSAKLYGADGLIYTCDEVVGMPQYATRQYYPSNKPLKDTIWLDLISSEVPKCRSCPYLFLCSGSCLLEGIARNGTPDEPNCPDIDGYLYQYVSYHEQDLIEHE